MTTGSAAGHHPAGSVRDTSASRARSSAGTTERHLPRDLPAPAAWGLFLLAVVAPLLRSPGVALWDTIWVEDGPVFVEQANSIGPLASLTHGYAGYLQTSGRLLAIPTVWMPPHLWAVYLALAGTVVGALCAAFVYRATRPWIATAAVRVALASMIVIGPALAIETTATITNAFWTILAVAPWAFFTTASRSRDIAARGAIVLIAALSTALAALLLPLALGFALARRARADVVVAACLAIGLVPQVLVTLGGGSLDRSPSSPRLVADLFGLRVLGSALVGERPLDQLWTGIGEPAVLLLVLLTVVIFVLLWPGAGRRNQTLVAVMLAYAVVSFLVPVWGRGTEIIGFDIGVYTLNMTRFTIGPIFLVVGAVAVLVDPASGAAATHRAQIGRRVLLIQIATVIAIGFFTETVRSSGPGWVDEAARVYRTECAGAPDHVVAITTSPQNFRVHVHCERLAP